MIICKNDITTRSASINIGGVVTLIRNLSPYLYWNHHLFFSQGFEGHFSSFVISCFIVQTYSIFGTLIAETLPGRVIWRIWTYWSHQYLYSTGDTVLQNFLLILKRLFQNYSKIYKSGKHRCMNVFIIKSVLKVLERLISYSKTKC